MKVGEYVRTKNKAPFEPSQIAKITDMKKDAGYKNQYFITLDHNLPTTYNFHIYSEDVIKSSSNIIDLIEVGDIIRGKDEHLFEVYAVGSDCVYINNLEEFIFVDEIKSIVTKEKFANAEYRVETN